MAIIPSEFGQVAWFRSDLLELHWYHYLNALSSNPRAMLLSRSIANEFDIKIGDTIMLTWSGQNIIDGIVYGFIDYWPTFNPIKSGLSSPKLVVANFHYIRSKMALEPYEIWAKKNPDNSSADIYNAIDDKKIDLVNLIDTTKNLIEIKNDALLQGTDGVLTLGFFVAIFISLIGFLIYWILILRDRTLQFGVLRAIGMSRNRVLTMLLIEQFLITGFSIFVGILVGQITSLLYVPLLQIVYAAKDLIPPFQVVSDKSDLFRIYTIAVCLMILGGILFRILIGRIEISQALKLGEE